MSAPVCPFIALGTDSGKRLNQANAGHACFAQRPSRALELDQQERFCLTSTFSSCPLFVAWATREAAHAISIPQSPANVSLNAPLEAAARGEELPQSYAGDDTIWSAAAAPMRALSPEEEERVRVVPLHQRRALEDEVPRAMIRLPRRLSSLRSLAAFIVLVGVLLFAAPSILKGVGSIVSGVGAQPSPSSSATATPDASPTPIPTPEPVTYIVKSGDSLFGISQKYQVSVDAILGANPDVTDANNLRIGQQLIIPSVLPDVVVSPSP